MRSGSWAIMGPLALAAMTTGIVWVTGATPPVGGPPSDQKYAQLRTDAVVRSRIETRLRMDDRIEWELLQVEVVQGHATLYGEVRTPQEKGLAALIASTVPGVTALTNNIIVEPAATKDRTLAKAIWNTFQDVPALSGNDTLRVTVKDTVVKLEGSVEQSVQKEAAEMTAASVPGVTTVINLIAVERKASGEGVTEKVREKMLQEGVEVQP